MSLEIPEATESELVRLRGYFPYRIIWCAHRNGEWVTGATLDKRAPNKLNREGWTVFTVKAVQS
jgi:hypothetical protein